MALRSGRRPIRRMLGVGAVAGMLAACGGGELLALVQIVTPLGGQWASDTSAETLSFEDAEAEDKLYESTLPVRVTLSSALTACGTSATLSGTLDNGELTLFPTVPASTTACMRGRFTDLRRLELAVTGETVKRAYLNDRVAVNLQEGSWHADSVGGPLLKFTEPASVSNDQSVAVAGCDATDAAAKVAFTGTLVGFNTTTLARPVIAALVGTAYTQVEVVDGATISLRDSAGRTHTLRRQRDTQTSCS